MFTDTTDKPRTRHDGQNIQRIRVYMGVKQETLATDMSISQQAVSNIEKQEELDENTLQKVADALGITPEVIKNFDAERAIYNINNHSFIDNTFEEGSTAIVQQFNPVDKIVELYERLLKSEREKNEIISGKNNPLN